MLTVFQSERGFPTPTTPYFEGVEQGLHDVNELFIWLRTKPANTWEFHRNVVNVAQKCFVGDENKAGLISWLKIIAEHPSMKMGYLHYQFILDTLSYIRTGFRRVSPMTTMSILDNTPHADKKTKEHENLSLQLRRQIHQVIEQIDPELDRVFIQKWLSHEGGLSDLVYTLYTLFGGINDKPSHPAYFTTPDGVAVA